MGEYTTINPNSKKERKKDDVYLTPRGMCKAALELLPEDFIPTSILDPGCGTGNWGEAVYNKWHIQSVGIDIREGLNVNDLFKWYEFVDVGADFLHKSELWPTESLNRTYDLIVGNPPFYLAEDFIRRAFELLRPEGYIMFLLRQAYLASEKRYNGLWKEYFPWRVVTSSRRPSFYFEESGQKGTDGEEYAMFIWNKSWAREGHKNYMGSMFTWEY